ncbi:universal stress protein [Meridianimarinicoccus roseus]|jgi:nucleotide-binding universal stress UspA family protein|uniref:Universal stress protein n=1 Tax=Meridianimarinicoccus roseus TaxID=2072018 RepID=A0A2V2LEJ9_9RHOB|nr:universal stress protein [Meridianimarinicoccus roseus]PWR03865.1 universal stress protein [Meridianimarinicoccus roseus]
MPGTVKTILCPVNLRHAADTTGAYATALAEAAMHDADLWVVTVAPEMERNLNIYDSEKYWGQKLREFLAANPPGAVRVQTRVLKGAAHRQIVKFALKSDIDLIVMSSANPRISDYLLGTTASHVVSHAPCSVYVVREPD